MKKFLLDNWFKILIIVFVLIYLAKPTYIEVNGNLAKVTYNGKIYFYSDGGWKPYPYTKKVDF